MSGRFKDWQMPEIVHGKLTQWNWVVYHPDHLKLGKNTDIGAFSFINALHGVEIGDNVQIGGGCFIYSVSTIDNKVGKVVLEENCSLGAQCTVMPGVTIGKNSIVGAHSLVTSDIPPDSVAFGVPARVVKRRE